MRNSRFTEGQIVGILKDGDDGVRLAELVRKHGISRATYFNWKSKYAGATVTIALAATLKRSGRPREVSRPGNAVTGAGLYSRDSSNGYVHAPGTSKRRIRTRRGAVRRTSCAAQSKIPS